ncbi:MAG: murein transglycosylase domain-containing protein [Sulfurimonas sp.]|uniref:murein transglycosylase domain-containing protein n=1 Tax=Sulfurimonas sp. TaxID=2022749 RepID=UPI0025E1E554|nr:murein transglycosylase domain-containing protein [Sulfurimonas sp.]MCK9454341.1 murein transglycosylase domain-containing protein [Sulfurimonas sp.]
MSLKSLIFLSLAPLLLAQSSSDFISTEMGAFEAEKNRFAHYKQETEDEFKSYIDAVEKEYKNYQKELSQYWQEPLLSTKTEWITYSKDMRTRSSVNFEKATIVIETIALSEEEAKERLKDTLADVVTMDTKKAHDSDPLEQRLSKIKKPSLVTDDEIKPEPILSSVIFTNEPSKDELITYVEKKSKDENIRSSSSKKIQGANIYRLNVSLPSDTMLKRSKIYYDEVKRQSLRQKIPVPLIFAIMHSESSFNPRARSHIPAYGLMQIVPRSAGIDAYLFLYNEKKLVSSNYLYNSKNNITMGSAYLHILYYKYLKEIKDPQSRLYCTIAAYNTGAGNVAWAFTKTNNKSKAANVINNLKPDEVYNTLLSSLKYDEPKEYLKRVSKRMLSYHKVYE